MNLSEKEKIEIINLYKKDNIIIEQKGRRLAKKFADYITSKNFGSSQLKLFDRNSLRYLLDGTTLNSFKVFDDQTGRFVDGDIEDFTRQIEKAIQDQWDDVKITRLLFKNDAKFVEDFLKAELEKVINGGFKVSEINDLLNNFRTFVDSAANNEVFVNNNVEQLKYIKSLQNLLSDNEFINLPPQRKIDRIKTFSKSKLQLSEKEVNILRNIHTKNLRLLLRLIRSLFKDTNKIKDEISDLINNSKFNDQSDLTSLGIAIAEKLNQLEARRNGLAESYFTKVKSQMPDELVKKIESADSIAKWDILRKGVPEDVKNSWNGFAEDLKGTWPLSFNRKGLLKVWPKWKKNSKFWKKLLTFILTGQLVTAEKAYKTIIGKSSPTKAMANLYFRSIFANITIPTIVAFLNSITGPTRDRLERSYNQWDELKNEGWLSWLPDEINISDFERDSKNDLQNLAKSFAYYFIESPYIDFGNEQQKDELLKFNFNDFLPGVNTYIDDIASFLVSTLGQGGSFEPIPVDTTVLPTAPVVANIPDDLDRTLETLFTNEYDSILRLIKVEGDDIIFKCGSNRGPGKFVKDNEGWKMKWDGYDGTYTIKDNLSLDNCDLLESVKGLANILLEQPRPGTEDPDDGVTPDTSEPEDTTPSPDTSEPEDTTPVPDTNDQESDNNTDPDTTPRDQERTEYNPSNRCVEELSTSYFCLKCKEGSSIEECNQTGDSLYDGECNLYDRQKIAREISQKLACVGMRPLKKGSLKVLNGKLYFAGEKRDQETKMDFELKKTIDGNNVQWLYKDEDGQFKDFIEQYHLNEHFLKNTIGLKNILENYRKN